MKKRLRIYLNFPQLINESWIYNIGFVFWFSKEFSGFSIGIFLVQICFEYGNFPTTSYKGQL
jgi:hypothetical protein